MYVQTERLELRPMDLAAVPALTELLTDGVVGKTYMLPDFADREAAQALARRLVALSEDQSRYVAGIYLGHQLIGLLNETQVNERSLEVGYALLPRYYGQGYATEALRGAIGYFLAQGFDEVVAGTFEENAASLRVMEKSGMTLLERQDVVNYRGKDHRCIYYCAGNPALR